MKRRAAFAAMFLASLAGCTLLVTFDDVPKDDGGVTVPTSRPQGDVAVIDSGLPDGPDEPETSTNVDAAVDYSKACIGQKDGKYCNGNQLFVDGGSKDDLVTCAGGKTANVKVCTNNCQRMPSGYPDECDQCQGKPTGLYCGDDFTGWHPMNANTRIRCDNGAIVGNLICSNACVGTGPSATCQ